MTTENTSPKVKLEDLGYSKEQIDHLMFITKKARKKTESIKVNLNQKVRCQLTELGLDCLEKYYGSFNQKIQENIFIGSKSDSVVELQLHEFCLIFGQLLYVGGQSVIVNTTIEVLPFE